MKIPHLVRQLDILPLEKLSEPITIIGAGAVGSFTALALAKMGFHHLTVIDPDKLEPENMNCQFYPIGLIGQPKVMALKEMIGAFADIEISTREEKYERGRFQGIVISAVDNMETRKRIWEEHKESEGTKLVVDPRMGAEQGLLYAMNPNALRDMKSYEKTLYTDENAVTEKCTAKSTMYTVLILSGMVAKVVKDVVTNKPYQRVSMLGIADNEYQIYKNDFRTLSIAEPVDRVVRELRTRAQFESECGDDPEPPRAA